MGSLDRQIRNEAVTMRANVFGHNYMDETEYDLTKGAYTVSGGYSDLCPLVGIRTTDGAAITPTPQAINSIRIMQPHQGELVECYIDYVQVRYVTNDGYTEPKGGGNSMSFAIGDFTNNDFTTPRTSYTSQEVMDSWKRISGRSTGITRVPGGEAVTYATRINLLPELIKAGNAKFVEDGFNLLLVFNNGLIAPDGTAGTGFDFKLESLRIVQSMTGVQ